MDINFKNGSKITADTVVKAGDMVTGYNGKSYSVSIPSQDDLSNMMKFFGMEADKIVQCPECDMKCQLVHMIPHLNDRGDTYSASYSTAWGKSIFSDILKQNNIKCFTNHEWSFKQIGKWLESLGY